MSIDQATFRQAMGHFATGITIVTTSHGDTLYGLTVTAFASLSLEPPLVLICIDKKTPAHTGLIAAEHFAVNFLSEDQENISRHFATRQQDKFTDIEYALGPHGSPLLEDAMVNIECKIKDRFPGGDHTVIVGEVLHVHIREQMPLLYFRSGYRRIAR